MTVEPSAEAEAGYDRAVADAAERHREQDEKYGHVHRALRNLMREVDWVPKTGHMDSRGAGGKYDFREIEQVVSALGRAARRHGLILGSEVTRFPEYVEHTKRNSSGNETVWTTCRGLGMRYVWTSTIDGTTSGAFEAVGEGKDSADKATSKAMTMAYKSALTQATMLPTLEPDPDSERPETEYAGGQGGGQDDGPDYTPDEVLQAIRGAQDTGLLGEIEAWLKERDLLGHEQEGQSFEAHLTAARRTLAPA